MVVPSLRQRVFAVAASSPPPPTKAAYLLWEPRVLRGVCVQYAAVAVAISLVGRSPGARVAERAAVACQELLLRSAHRFEAWALLSLLSSSCCVLQLALNVFSVGCAGFNAVMGPARPLCLALALHARRRLGSAAAQSRLVDPVVRRANAVGAAVAFAVALAPECVALLALARRRRGPKALAKGTAASVLTVALPSMGCVACVDAVGRAVRAVAGVAAADVSVGAAAVRLDAGAEPDATAAAVRDACAAAGFEVASASWGNDR